VIAPFNLHLSDGKKEQMGRFLAIVIVLVALALVINSFQSAEKPAAVEGTAA
jgi:hypothetical protein